MRVRRVRRWERTSWFVRVADWVARIWGRELVPRRGGERGETCFHGGGGFGVWDVGW